LALDADNIENFNAGPGRLFSPQVNNLRRTQDPRTTPRMEPVSNILSGRNSEKREEEIKSMKALLEEQKKRLKDMNSSGAKSHRPIDGQSVVSHGSEIKSRGGQTVLSQGSL